MTMEHMDAIGIGWDVRGWQGSAQAVAVVGWQAREQRLHWFGVSPLFRLSSRVAPDLDALLRPALHDEIHLLQVLACPQLALGIDAPLAFPRALGELLAGRATECAVPQREIDNPYAYRDCERWLHRQYGKKPLSATFDRLGNNATLALAMLPRLADLQLVPKQQPQADRAVLEVYPALAKVGGKASTVRAELLAHLPADVTAGTDRYDAAICALMALQYAAKGSVSLLPALVAPPAEMALDEGWVYHFARP
ncbi:hypothetical protein OPFLODJI_01932 [Aeromonas hydrophila]|uniref:DUF429 domain-containing protein n=1 Tax=Aeromonas hydrophila TaxID=644 RepID=UPI0021697104|nr:DUF429 domain-containing protein [Aeromonas hydrophila]MCS3768497.1 putative nuclease with RNAse H fold [Aeromonas hydrophila]MCS3792857.1 putative nuclease with RNAse H fold [Aeromonas hydrophila]